MRSFFPHFFCNATDANLKSVGPNLKILISTCLCIHHFCIFWTLMSHFMHVTLHLWSQCVLSVLYVIWHFYSLYLISALISFTPQVRPHYTHGSSLLSPTWAASWIHDRASWPRVFARWSWTWRRCTSSLTWRKTSQDSIPSLPSLPLAWALCLVHLLCDDLVPTILITRKSSSEKMEGPLEWGQADWRLERRRSHLVRDPHNPTNPPDSL